MTIDRSSASQMAGRMRVEERLRCYQRTLAGEKAE